MTGTTNFIKALAETRILLRDSLQDVAGLTLGLTLGTYTHSIAAAAA